VIRKDLLPLFAALVFKGAQRLKPSAYDRPEAGNAVRQHIEVRSGQRAVGKESGHQFRY
jgi:hypothetical protein